MDPFSHEQPLLLAFPAEARAEALLPALLGDRAIRHLHFPAPWALEGAGIDAVEALPDVRSVTLETVGEVLGTLIRLCDEQALEALVRRAWAEVDERVRQYYLDPGFGRTLAMIFRAAPRSIGQPPPPAFRRDRILENGFAVEYRLARVARDEERDVRAPEEEGSIVLYPFDPSGVHARGEAGLEPGSGPVFEVFPYEAGRVRHRETWEQIAARHGGRLVETRAPTA